MSVRDYTNHPDKVPQGWSYFLDDPTAPVPPELQAIIRQRRIERQQARKMHEFQRNFWNLDNPVEAARHFPDSIDWIKSGREKS